MIILRISGAGGEPRSERDRKADEQMSGLCHDDPFLWINEIDPPPAGSGASLADGGGRARVAKRKAARRRPLSSCLAHYCSADRPGERAVRAVGFDGIVAVGEQRAAAGEAQAGGIADDVGIFDAHGDVRSD